jgi:hypothetical protein
MYKLRDWIDSDKLDWPGLSTNPAAIHLLEEHPYKIDWYSLSRNPAAIHLLEANLDKIYWPGLSMNPAAIHLLEANLDKILVWVIQESGDIYHLRLRRDADVQDRPPRRTHPKPVSSPEPAPVRRVGV